MTSSNGRRDRSVLAFATLPVLLLCALLATCRGVGGPKAPRHSWHEDWGPLVPHKEFPADCGLCHVSDRWDVLRQDFSFDHEKQTGTRLEGAHKGAACLRCHNDFGPVEAYVERGCAGCHLDPHQAQLDARCTRCHNQERWRPDGMVAEHARTRFPLVGAHLAVACELCHPRAPTGTYTGAPTDCAICHRDDVQRATSPDHAAQGWVDRCERCHVPTTWGAGGFTHAFFPLTGGHAALDCTRCHTGGTFGGTSSACLDCHQDDYARAQNHSGFPRTCQNCHTTSTWKGATFNHTFPITGPHRVDCGVCHPGGTSAFTCLDCHEHRRSEMDDEHREISGYRYDSLACLQCHPAGND